MGYHCDFCGEQRSIVYCRSDAASLCLSCDRNVHSANALSRRHSRTLVCERCNSQPAFVRCMEERTSLCQNCDWMGHTGSNTGPAHKRQPVNCYSGCPSAAELSEIWSFLLDFPSVDDSTCEQGMGSMSITDNRPGDCQGSQGKNNVQNASLLMDKSTVWMESATPLLDPNLHNVDQIAGSSCSTTPKEMARTRFTARKSIPAVSAQETFMIPSSSYQPRTRAQAAIRMKQIALDNQDRTIKRLRASNAERRREVEDLNLKLTTAVKRVSEIHHMLELARGDNYDLRDTIDAAVGQAKRARAEVDLKDQELAKMHQARAEDKEKIKESWTTIMQLSENNQRLTKEVDKGKAKRKALKDKIVSNHQHAKNVLNEAVAEIQTHIDKIAELEHENANLHFQIEDLLEPEEPEEDPEEEEEAPPDVAVGNGEIE